MYEVHRLYSKLHLMMTKIWRYMDFTKYVSLLARKALFFPSITRLQQSDPFEGIIPEKNVKDRHELHSEFYQVLPPEIAARNINDMDLALRRWLVEQNKFTVVNCWYTNEHEFMAMWKLYGDAIAIGTTIKNFASSFIGLNIIDTAGESHNVPIYIAGINYLDYEKEFMPTFNTFYPVLHKRKEFEHEREVRAFASIWPMGYGAKDYFAFHSD